MQFQLKPKNTLFFTYSIHQKINIDKQLFRAKHPAPTKPQKNTSIGNIFQPQQSKFIIAN